MKAKSKQQDLGHMLSMEGGLWGSWTKVRLVNSSQKEAGFGKLHKALNLRDSKGKALESKGDCCSQGFGGSGERILPRIYICLWLFSRA